MKKTEFKRAETPLIYESPEARVWGMITDAVLCGSSDSGSDIEDAGEEIDDIFGE